MENGGQSSSEEEFNLDTDSHFLPDQFFYSMETNDDSSSENDANGQHSSATNFHADTDESGNEDWSSESSLSDQETSFVPFHQYDPTDLIDPFGEDVPSWVEEEKEAVIKQDRDHPLEDYPLPVTEDRGVASLQMIAAAKYTGSIKQLPSPLATMVETIVQIKDFIFGVDRNNYSLRHNFPKSSSYHLLYQSLVNLLENRGEDSLSDQQDSPTPYQYDYRVSLNGLFCGYLKGPESINRSFIRFIYHQFAPQYRFMVTRWKKGHTYYRRQSRWHQVKTRQLLVHRWHVEGYRVYRFTPIPTITTLPLRLTQWGQQRSVILTVTRSPKKQS